MLKLIFNRLPIVIISVLLVFSLHGCKAKAIEGNEWLVLQKSCLEDLEAYTKGMDEVFTLYILGSISEPDFETELSLLNSQYALLLNTYNQMQEDHPVKEGTHSYLSKRGTEGIEKSYELIGEILNNLHKDGAVLSRDELAYTYIAYQQSITQAVAEYVTAYQLYTESLSTGAIE